MSGKRISTLNMPLNMVEQKGKRQVTKEMRTESKCVDIERHTIAVKWYSFDSSDCHKNCKHKHNIKKINKSEAIDTQFY